MESTTRRTYGFVREPHADLYRAILVAGLEHGDTVGLVYQNLHRGGYQNPVEALDPYLIDEQEVSEWPGTRRMSGNALLRRYRFDQGMADVMTQLATSLFDWQFPALPEDVHVLRLDGSVWLGSIAHERDAWLDLSDEELSRLRSAYPNVAEAIAAEDDQRAFIARLWKEHLDSPFPQGVAGEEISEGVTLAYLDSTVAGCIDSFVSGSANLDQERLQVLATSWFDLDEASSSFDVAANSYFYRLWRITDLTLAFHHVDPFAHLRQGNSDQREHRGSRSRRS